MTHAPLIGYTTQPFCGKHCCHDLPLRRTHKVGRIAKRQQKRKEQRQWRRETY